MQRERQEELELIAGERPVRDTYGRRASRRSARRRVGDVCVCAAQAPTSARRSVGV